MTAATSHPDAAAERPAFPGSCRDVGQSLQRHADADDTPGRERVPRHTGVRPGVA